jgi:hypothetical protein
MNATRSVLGIALLLALTAFARGDEPAKPPEMLDLADAVVVTPAGRSGPEAKAVEVLVEEVRKRTQLHWPVVHQRPEGEAARATIYIVGKDEAEKLGNERELALAEGEREVIDRPEGFRIQVDAKTKAVWVRGNDPRGVLYGVGRLLRELRLSRGQVLIPAAFRIATAPKIALRGHQLGYRPKTNSYDAWDLAMWDQYIRDLAIFGTNAVELIPPRSDDDADSPHFPISQMEALIGMSKIADSYGMDVWIWYPAMDPKYDDPKTVEAELKAWDAVLSKIPRLDAVFVPGGDPGHTQPKILMPFLEKVTEVLHRSHPEAEMWMSPQGFNKEWTEEFYEIMKREPKWLTGLVHGPQIRPTLIELRKAIPTRYPIRNYPDITHSRQCQFPVPDWDHAFAVTEGRETINPRPRDEQTIFRYGLDSSIGFLTYSEGCNDDVNKIVWSGLGWNPDMPVVEILRQYGRYFISDRFAEGIAQGLLALESNWRGPLIVNQSVETTLKQFQDMEKAANPRERLSWRFQQALYRAYYDATVRDRLIYETDLENRAMNVLGQADKLGAQVAMAKAGAILDQAVLAPVSLDRRARVFALAEALFQSIRMQLSVPKYQAIATDRGANLDSIDVPLNNRVWLKKQFAELREKPSESDRQSGIKQIVQWTNPGLGGFYDDLGNLTRQPHLVRGLGFARDPDIRKSSAVGFGGRPDWPISWTRHAFAMHEQPVQLHYDGLDTHARYKVRVVYAGDNFRYKVKLDSETGVVHDWFKKPMPPTPVEFDVPAEATADGDLTLSWHTEPGLGGNGRSNQVAEVWLIKKGR